MSSNVGGCLIIMQAMRNKGYRRVVSKDRDPTIKALWGELSCKEQI